METRIIACESISDEITKALELSGRDLKTTFLKPGLDNKPQDLRDAIESIIKPLPEPEVILLGYGFSNGALVDFPAGKHTLVAPEAEDAICLILGSQTRRDAILGEKPSYVLTEGWLKGDSLFEDFNKAVEKYGQAKATRLHKSMMSHYQRFLLIDTGVYDIAPYRTKLEELGEILGLEVEVDQGDLSWLVGLVSGPPWGQGFVTAKPGEYLTIDPQAGSRI